MNILHVFNEENVPEEDLGQLDKRTATRAVIFDNEDRVVLLYSEKFNYHEIPGGGVEMGETLEESVIRECKEETGCDIEITRKVGVTHEVRKKKNQLNETHCYVANVVGEKGDPVFEQDEIEEGFKVVWFTPEEAMQAIEDIPNSEKMYIRYIKQRALLFLQTAFNNEIDH